MSDVTLALALLLKVLFGSLIAPKNSARFAIYSLTLVSLLSSLTIESVQHYIGRSFDIDDIILNIVGGIIGFLLYTALNAIRNNMPKFLRRDWFLNVISVIILILMGLYIYKIM